MKKFVGIFLCAAMVLTMAACSDKDKDSSQGTNSSSSQQESSNSAQLPNPIHAYTTLEEAQDAVDFEIQTLPNLPEGYELKNVSVINGELVQLVYQNEDAKLTYRTAKAGMGDDISGDYNAYTVTEEVTVSDRTITLKGDTKSISLAIWQEGELSFSLMATPGLTQQAMEDALLLD